MIVPKAVTGIALTVSDADKATVFYTDALNCRVLSDHVFEPGSYSQLAPGEPSAVRLVVLKLGEELIELVQYLDCIAAPIPPDSRSHDLWFQHMAIVVSDMDRAYDHLLLFDIEPISSGPQTMPDNNPDSSGVRAFKFKDLDRHSLELIWFPPDKRKPKWEPLPETLFLGIDHSAISVSDTQRSLSFYRDALNLNIAGRSHNTGPVQAALDNLPGADVKITTLGSDNMGIELLDYLQPSGSRPRNKNWRISDLPHRHLILEVQNLHDSLDTLQHSGVILSPRIVSFPNDYRYAEGRMLQDPDGHSLLLVTTP